MVVVLPVTLFSYRTFRPLVGVRERAAADDLLDPIPIRII
jgi:hypothetical protein